MACEKCGSSESRVVLTKRSPQGLLIRRRRCLDCNHRYYTVQPFETVVPSHEVLWVNSWSNNGSIRFIGTL